MAVPHGEACDVFLSYCREDAGFMRRLQSDLRAVGLSVWIDDVGLEPGTPAWESAVEQALESARAMVVVLSPAAKRSVWVGRELSYGEEHRVPIFPVLAAGSEQTAVPLRLASSQWVDARSDYLGAIHRLRAALLGRLGREPAVEAELPIPESDRRLLESETTLLDRLRRFQQLAAEREPAAAMEIFTAELGDPLARLGAFATRIEALRLLLGPELEHAPRLEPAARGRAVEELARSYLGAGRPRPADDLLGDAIAAWRHELDPGATADLLTLLGETRLQLGELAGADRILTAAARSARELEDDRRLARATLATGRLLTYLGDYDGAFREIDAARKVAWDVLDTELEARAQGLRAWTSWQMGASTPAIQGAQQALDLAEHIGSAPLAAWIAWLLASVHLSLASITRYRPENLQQAQAFLNQVKEICGRVPLPELEPDRLFASARLFRIKGNPAMAARLAEEALQLAEAGEYALKEADCHNLLARLAIDAGNRDRALRHAAAAHEAAKGDGHRYEAAFARARASLESLGQAPQR